MSITDKDGNTSLRSTAERKSGNDNANMRRTARNIRRKLSWAESEKKTQASLKGGKGVDRCEFCGADYNYSFAAGIDSEEMMICFGCQKHFCAQCLVDAVGQGAYEEMARIGSHGDTSSPDIIFCPVCAEIERDSREHWRS